MDDRKALGAGMGIARMKYWDEMGAAEKIELLGEQIEGLSRIVAEQANQIDILRIHQHSADGTLLAKLDATHPHQPRYNPPHYLPNPLRRERR